MPTTTSLRTWDAKCFFFETPGCFFFEGPGLPLSWDHRTAVFQPPNLWLCQNSYGKSPFLMGKSTISMAIFNSYVKLPEGI